MSFSILIELFLLLFQNRAWEHRDGDKVHGEYTLDEADGTKRVVKYSADKHSGFTAHVERIGHADHPAHVEHHDHHEHHEDHGHHGHY